MSTPSAVRKNESHHLISSEYHNQLSPNLSHSESRDTRSEINTKENEDTASKWNNVYELKLI